jgi:two-component system response regulator AtoC
MLDLVEAQTASFTLSRNCCGMFVAVSASMARKVLVVEDDPITRWNLAEFLNAQGFDVDQIPDGMRALERFKQQSYDLVITDFRIPGLDGLKLIQRVRSVSPATPVIIMTGTPSLDQDSAQALGAAAFIRKPLHLGNLLARIRKLLEQEH